MNSLILFTISLTLIGAGMLSSSDLLATIGLAGILFSFIFSGREKSESQNSFNR